MAEKPTHIDLKKDRGLTILWDDGTEDFYPLLLLRRMSPSADAKALRDEMVMNPLAVLPSSATGDRVLTATDAELVGNYAIRIRFSDGHDTGIYSWPYLLELRRYLAPATNRGIERAGDRTIHGW